MGSVKVQKKHMRNGEICKLCMTNLFAHYVLWRNPELISKALDEFVLDTLINDDRVTRWFRGQRRGQSSSREPLWNNMYN
ncbi:unnamed protein product [Lupinus luteus]|uniref:Uncharacterized protein n=1 Tax=Lupinus luteus TaxID=3873 RepID=A0AAV1Y086_LUPLU